MIVKRITNTISDQAQNRLSYFKTLALSICVALIATSCGDDEPTVEPNEYLIDLELRTALSVSAIQTSSEVFGVPELGDLAEHDIRIYVMDYTTTYKGAEVVASAIIGIPQDVSGELAIASLQHGTLVKKADAPSFNTFSYQLLAATASLGFVAVIPDFLGFGSSESLFHPYYVYEPSARSVVDAIQAASELMEDSALVWNDNVFLAGYSEGGYVTMAAHKYLQDHPEEGLTVTASAPAAGGYDLLHMKDYFFGLESYDQPFYLAFVLTAYDSHYEWNANMNTFFQEPYASQIPGLFDGSLSGGEINEQLTNVVQDLLDSDMVENFDTGAEYADFKQALIDNTLSNWVPTAPVRLYHGTDDITVPYDNTLSSLETFRANGVGESMTLVPLEGENHASGFIPMFLDVLPWFLELRTQ